MKRKTLFTAFLTFAIRNVLLSHRYKKNKIEKATWFGRKSVTQPLRQLLSKDLTLTAADMSTFYNKLRGIYFAEIQTQSKKKKKKKKKKIQIASSLLDRSFGLQHSESCVAKCSSLCVFIPGKWPSDHVQLVQKHLVPLFCIL